MAHKTVQLIIGRLLTDEEFRDRFLEDPRATLSSVIELGLDLTGAEVDALLRTDVGLWRDVAARIDPQLQKCRLH